MHFLLNYKNHNLQLKDLNHHQYKYFLMINDNELYNFHVNIVILLLFQLQ